ncbi:MAG: SPOR domain-containing protein, partial [Bacteroidetes bacterium]|nr:SPOR domain-containing protein [Bacteroidota bacterium]
KMIAGGRLSAVPGLTLELQSLTGKFRKSISVFNDGSFYYMGLAPGKYEASVDSAQMATLGVYSDPARLKFEIRPTKNGDYVEGLKILLIGRKSEEAALSSEQPPIEPTAAAKPESRQSARVSTIAPRDNLTVQIGSFMDRGRAQGFAREARRTTGLEIGTHFNKELGMYVVRTEKGSTKQEALRVLGLLKRRSLYRDAFIVSDSGESRSYLFSIQVAAFHSVSSAREYALRILRDDGIKGVVRYSRSKQFYAVMVGVFRTKRECDAATDTLRRTPGFSGAFSAVYGVSRGHDLFAVLIGTCPDHAAAEESAAKFRRETGLSALVDFNDSTMKFMVITPTYRGREEAESALKRIRTFEGYADARVISLP